MEATNQAPDVAGATLHAALLSFARAPGRWRLQAGEPAVLFASVPRILLLAGTAREPDPALRAAALLFIRVGLLYPHASARAVFGYAPGADTVGLKERYRLLARLTHPDRAAAVAVQWPEGTAARVNLAYQVLTAPPLPAVRPPARHPGRRRARRARRKAATFSFGPRCACAMALGVAVVVGLLLDTPGGESLVQAPMRTVRMAAAVAAELPVFSDAAPVRLHLSRRLGHDAR